MDASAGTARDRGGRAPHVGRGGAPLACVPPVAVPATVACSSRRRRRAAPHQGTGVHFCDGAARGEPTRVAVQGSNIATVGTARQRALDCSVRRILGRRLRACAVALPDSA